MTKCPYCGEEIRGKAVVCEHCGLDLTAREYLTSPWMEGVKAAVLLSLGVFFAGYSSAPNQAAETAWLLVGLPVSFLIFWIVCSFVVVLWRRAFVKHP